MRISMNMLFQGDSITDGIHTTESGHAPIAREWIRAFKAMFE